MAKEEKKLQSFSSFNSGEYSPSLSGRVDLESYGSSARLMSNFMSEATGGIKKFYGTKHITSLQTDDVLLVPFTNEFEPMAFVFYNGVIGLITTNDFVDTDMKVPAGVINKKLRWQQINDIVVFVSETTKPFTIRFGGRGEASYIFSLEDTEFDEVPYFPFGWSGNYNGAIQTNGGTSGTITVDMSTSAAKVKVQYPDILAGRTSANMLGENTGIDTRIWYAGIHDPVYPKFEIPHAQARLIRVRDSRVLAEGVVSGGIVACNGEAFEKGDYDSDGVGTRFVYRSNLLNIIKTFDSGAKEYGEYIRFKQPEDSQPDDQYRIDIIIPRCYSNRPNF